MTSLAAARIALSVVFFINGAMYGTWVSRIPAIQDQLALGTGLLGVALLSMAAGALFGMKRAGVQATRSGSRPVIIWTMSLMCLTLMVVGFSFDFWSLCAVLAVLGMFAAAMDVAMNTHAVTVERLYGRPIMSSLHGLFSIGGMVGAFVGALMASLRIEPSMHFMIAGVLLGVVGVVCQRWLLPAETDSQGSTEGDAAKFSIFAMTPDLVALSVVTFCCFISEGAMGDWTGVYLHHVLHTDVAFAPVAFVGFSVAMSVGRLSGDWINHKIGPLNLLRGGALIALIGLAMALIPMDRWLAVGGFSLIGIGLANIVPVSFASAGHSDQVSAGRGIAAVAMLAYFGLLVGPPVIGFAAELIGLRYALGLVGLLIAIMIGLSDAVSPKPSSN